MKTPSLITKADSQEVDNAVVKGREPMIQPTLLKSNNKSHSELLENSKTTTNVNEAETPTFTPKRKLKFNQKLEICSNFEKINKGARKLTNKENPEASNLLSFETGVKEQVKRQIGGVLSSEKAMPSSLSSGTAWWHTIT